MTTSSLLPEKAKSGLKTLCIWLAIGVVWFACMVLFGRYGGSIVGDDGVQKIQTQRDRRMQRAKDFFGAGNVMVQQEPEAKKQTSQEEKK